MNPADRLALVDRLARGMAWGELEEHQRADFKRRADKLISELEIGREQTDRIGWLLVEVEAEEAEP